MQRPVVTAGVALAVILLVALAPGRFQRALLVETRRTADTTGLLVSATPAEAGAFFAERDTTTIVVPRDLSRSEFLSLYHLRNTTGVTDSLDALGVRAEGDSLRKGTRVFVHLTPRSNLP